MSFGQPLFLVALVLVPLALAAYRTSEQRRRAAAAAEAYGIPVLARDELLAYARWHGEVAA